VRWCFLSNLNPPPDYFATNGRHRTRGLSCWANTRPSIGGNRQFQKWRQRRIGEQLGERGIMNIDQNSPSVGKVGTLASRPGHFLSNWTQVLQIQSSFRSAKQKLSTLISKNLVLDVIERAVVLTMFLYFANRMLSQLSVLIVNEIAYPELLFLAPATNLQATLLVISESLGVFLILTRRWATALSSNPFDWTLSLIALNAPLLAVPAPASTFIPSQIALALMLTGMIIQISAKAALWRSFGIVPANRGIKTGGPYRFVRHPMYVGYTLTHIGFLLGFPLLQNSLLYFTAFLIEVARLLREELILNQDPSYREYAARVRYRLVPGIF
jgi:protein-S-isoprenylcysteine O-methyltransferase Ste14